MMTHVVFKFYKSANLTINNSIYQYFKPINNKKDRKIILQHYNIDQFFLFLSVLKEGFFINKCKSSHSSQSYISLLTDMD